MAAAFIFYRYLRCMCNGDSAFAPRQILTGLTGCKSGIPKWQWSLGQGLGQRPITDPPEAPTEVNAVAVVMLIFQKGLDIFMNPCYNNRVFKMGS